MHNAPSDPTFGFRFTNRDFWRAHLWRNRLFHSEVFSLKKRTREEKTVLELPFPLWPFSQDLYDLLPKQDVFLSHRAVVMEVSKEPVFIFQSPVYHLQKFREMVRFVVAVHRQGNAGGGAVGDHIVHLPICSL